MSQTDPWLAEAVSKMGESYRAHPHLVEKDTDFLPQRRKVIEIIDILRDLLFPGYFSKENIRDAEMPFYIGSRMSAISHKLTQQVKLALCHSIRSGAHPETCCNEAQNDRAKTIVTQFLQRLPHVQEPLNTDVQAAYDGDPAARSYADVVLSYPGILALFCHRTAHELYLLRVPLIPRMISEYAHSLTGIDIHPGAEIGPYFFIDHGTGVVIGETTVIGHHVKIYQGVTLGALSTSGGQKLRNIKRHPTIGDYVTVYGGSTILGGDTVIGKHVVIGGNVFISQSVDQSTQVMLKNPSLDFREKAPKQ